MWGNREVASLARRLRDHNATLPPDQRVGFHGLDVYSLFESLDAVIAQLEEVNPILARRARVRYECFLPFRRDERRYARSLLEFPAGCQEQVIANLKDLLAARLRARAGADADEALFDAEQNARVVRNAEDYYRTMVHGTEDSWNVRDRHMQETLELLLERYDARLGAGTRAIVWAHNTHIGDYRATDMLRMGQVNLGGLARERLGEGAVALVGFSTYEGSVIASPAWDGPIQRLPVPPGRHGSWDAALHEAALAVGSSTFWSIFDPSSRRGPLGQNRGQRAIGVVYDPEHERWGNYVPTSLARRYDCLVHVDRTRALEPIPIGFDREELPETWPAGF
jgi:erythromycin esterase-like protein